MTYLNKKERVIELDLTPHGKKLLSEGKLLPVYYSFHDNDIIYDLTYADSPPEHQNDTAPRIKNTDCLSIPVAEVGPPLGTSDDNNPNIPSWAYNVEQGTIVDIREGVQTEVYMKPCRYTTHVVANASPSPSLALRFQDRTGVKVQAENLLVGLEELNTVFVNDNYELEVYICEETKDGEEMLFPLTFHKEKKNIVNNILLSDEELGLEPDLTITEQHVEYYFDLRVDEEIDNYNLLYERDQARQAASRVGVLTPTDDSYGESVTNKKKSRTPSSSGNHEDNSLYDTEVNEEEGPFGSEC